AKPAVDEVLEAIQMLATPQYMTGVERLRRRGRAVVPRLLDAMRDAQPIVRARACQLVGEILGGRLRFDPLADAATRDRQLEAIRVAIERRLAG
ncbi:MAG: hypothetical protein ACRDD1_05740, partial [Planctomycetia bacterium]